MFGNQKVFAAALAGILCAGLFISGEEAKKTTIETYSLAPDKTVTLDLQAGGNVTITG